MTNIIKHSIFIQQEYLFGDKQRAKKIIKSLTSLERDLFAEAILHPYNLTADPEDLRNLDLKLKAKIQKDATFQSKTFKQSIKAIWDNRFHHRKKSKEILQLIETSNPTPKFLKELEKKLQDPSTLTKKGIFQFLNTHRKDISTFAIQQPHRWLFITEKIRLAFPLKTRNDKKFYQKLEALDIPIQQFIKRREASYFPHKQFAQLNRDILEIIQNTIPLKTPTKSTESRIFTTPLNNKAFGAIKTLQVLFKEPIQNQAIAGIKTEKFVEFVEKHKVPFLCFLSEPCHLKFSELKRLIAQLSFLNIAPINSAGSKDEALIIKLLPFATKVKTLLQCLPSRLSLVPNLEEIQHLGLLFCDEKMHLDKQTVARLTSLETLELTEIHLSDVQVLARTIKTLPKLKHLSLIKPSLTSSLPLELPHLESLEFHHLNWLTQITDLAPFSQYKNLKTLLIKDTLVSDREVACFKELPLTKLEIVPGERDPGFKGTAFQDWKHPNELKYLQLDTCGLTKDGIRNLKQFKSLETLKLARCPGLNTLEEAKTFQNEMNIPNFTWDGIKI